MLTLRDYAERCRQLALIARHPGIQRQLLVLADDLARHAGAYERRQAAETDRRAG